MEDAAVGAVISQLSKRILEKMERGKKLSSEDILLLYLDLQYRELREVNNRLDAMYRDLVSIYRDLVSRIDSVEKTLREDIGRVEKTLQDEIGSVEKSLREEIGRLEARIDETNKRIDQVLNLLAARQAE